MPALDRRSFIGLAAASASSLLLGAASGARAQSVVDTIPVEGDFVRLNYNENPLGPSASARAAMKAAVDISGRYGIEQQSQLLQLFAHQHDLPVDHISLFCGSGEALQYAVLAFTGKDRPLVVADPSYEQPITAAQGWGTPVHRVPLTASHAHDLSAMLQVDAHPGLIYLCNPNNPTGTLTPKQDIDQLLANKPKSSIVVIDEAYLHFADAPSFLDIAKTRNDVLVLRTFSKIYGLAGARLGLAIGHPDLLARLNLFGGGNSAPVSTLVGALASLADPALVSGRKARNRQTRDGSIAWFKKHGFAATDSQANFFMVDVRQPAEQMIAALKKRQVLIGRVWSAWPTWVRITVGTPKEMTTLHQAFANVLEQGAGLHSVG